MSVVSADTFERELHRGIFHAAYFLLGPEEYLRRQALVALRTRLLEGQAPDFSCEEFDSGQTAPSRVLTALNTLPMLAARRVVVMTAADQMQESLREALHAYLQRPNPKSALIMTSENFDRRTAFYKLVKEKAQVVEFPKLKGYALSGWAEDYIRRRGYAISPADLRKLVDMAGSDLQALIGEIEKLLLYAGEEKTVPGAAIEALVRNSRQHSIFELTDALGQMDRAGALRLLNRLLDSGEPPLLILAMIARHFRQLLIAKELLREGRPAREIGQAAQVPPFVLDAFLRQARSMELGTAERIYARLGYIDLKIKSTSAGERLLLESLIHALPG
ncbi:MAG: DNA polymerase III subunit delta [Acidobacteria bacterium]|nr:DNA polymerase III subunit delta [Acidobacteriota bacterium]